MHTITPHITHFAAGGSDAVNNFFTKTPIGTNVVGPLLAFLGVVIILGAVAKAAFDILGGSKQKPIKLIAGALVIGILMIQPTLVGSLIDLVTTWVTDIINSIAGVTNSGPGSGPPTTVITGG